MLRLREGGAVPGNVVELSRHTGTDCRYPVDRDVSPLVIQNVWIPAVPAGTTDKIPTGMFFHGNVLRGCLEPGDSFVS